MACPPDKLKEFIELRRTFLKEKGLSESEILADLSHLKTKLLDPIFWAKVSGKRGLTESEKQELADLIQRTKQAIASGAQRIRSIGDNSFRRLKELVYRNSSQTGARPNVKRSIDTLNELERKYKEAGDNIGVGRIQRVRKKLQQISDTNTKNKKDYAKINSLNQEIDAINEEIHVLTSIIEMESDSLKEERKSLIRDGLRLQEISKKIDSEKNSKKKGELKKKASEIKKRIAKSQANIKRGQAKSQTKFAKEIQIVNNLRKKQAEIVDELSKYGISRGAALSSLANNISKTARSISLDMENVSKDIAFRRNLINELLKDSKTINTTTLATILGVNFVMSRFEKDVSLSKREVGKLLKEWSSMAFQYAGSHEKFISDIDFADSDSLNELEQVVVDSEDVGATIDEANSDLLIVPTMSTQSQIENSTPGNIPEDNVLSEEDGIKLFNALKSFLSRMETLRQLPNFGRFVEIGFLHKIISDINIIDDVDLNQLLNTAVRWKKANLLPSDMSSDEMMQITKALLLDLGLDREVLEGREFTDPINWINNAKLIALDIETYLDGTDDIHTVILMDEDSTQDYGSVKSSQDNIKFTNDELMSLLIEIEEKQNNGSVLVTFNGNNFDLLAIAEKIGTEEARKVASRIMLRSVDLFQNLRSFNSSLVNDPSPKSVYYNLSNVAGALNIEETKLFDNYQPPLLKKRSQGQTVTLEDLSSLSDSKLSRSEKEIIIEAINDLTPSAAALNLMKYSMSDGALNIRVMESLKQREGSSVRIPHANGTLYAVVVDQLIPTWAFSSRYTQTYSGLKDSTSNWSHTEVGQQMQTAFDSLLTTEGINSTVVDLDEARKIIESLMVMSLKFNPRTKAFHKVINRLALKTVTEEEQAYITAIKIARDGSKASQKLNQKAYEDNGSRLPIGIGNTGGFIPRLIFAKGTDKDQRNQYIDSVLNGFRDQLKKEGIHISELVEKEQYTENYTDNNEYIFNFIIDMIKKYTNLSDFDIVDFGNGKLDFAVGDSLGRGIVQIILQSPQGFRKSINAKALGRRHRKLNDEITKSGNIEKRTYQSLIFRAPTESEVHHIFPRTLAEVESSFVDYRLRQRIKYILETDITDPNEVINAYKNLVEDPNEVLTDRIPEILMQLIPNVNARALYNQLPSLDDLKERTIEALLDLPELLVMWQHDSATYAPGSKIFLNEEARNRYFADDALSPGSISGASLLSGLGPLFAHVKTYPMLGEKLIYDSLDRGIKQYKEGGFSRSNYFDFNMNGVHHMAALTLMYLDTDGSRLDEILADVGLVDEVRDRYQETVDLLRDNLDMIKASHESLNQFNEAKQAELLKEFLTSADTKVAREGFKTAVVARLYMGGLPAVTEAIQNWMDESGIDIKGVDASFIAEHLMNQKQFLQFNILDEALGITEKQKRELAAAIANELKDVYSADWTKRLKEIANRNGFKNASQTMFTLNQIEDAIKERLKFIAAMTGKTEEEVFTEYEDRITKANAFMSENGPITNDEQMRKLNVILMGNEQNYKTTPTLIALNALQRVGYRLRGTQADGIRGRIEEHSDILGRLIEESDILGFEHFNIYFLMGFDSSGGRAYMVGNRLQPINSSLSTIYRENTPQNKDDKPYAMWAFNKNNFSKLNRKDAELEISKLIARHIALQLSHRYAPKFGNYNMEVSESREGFMEEWNRRSSLEDIFHEDKLRDESILDNGILDLRQSSGGLLKNSLRFLLDPSRTFDDAIDSEYNPGMEKSTKGLGGFRPEYAAFPWQERGIMSLQEMFYNKKLQEIKQRRLRDGNKEPETINDVIPRHTRGYKNRYKGSKAPYIYSTAVDSIYEISTGDLSRRLELRANDMRNTLEKFGMTHGHEDLVESQNWAKLYTIWKVSNAIVSPFVSKMAKLSSRVGTEKERQDYITAQINTLDMYYSLSNLWSFHDSVSHESRSYLEFGRMIGIDGQKIQDMHYIDLLKYFSDQGIDVLKPIKLGLTPTNNIVVLGDPSADDRTTRILTLTVQSLDSLQMIYNVVYQTVGREIATDYMRKVDPNNFDSLEKDGNGFVLLSSVPKKYQKAILKEIFNSEKTQRKEEFNLYLFLDDFGGAQIGNNVDYDNVMNKVDVSSAAAPKKRGGDKGMPRFDTTRTNANTIYKLTPEDLTLMFTQIQNQVLLRNAELAAALGSEIGVTDNEAMQFMNAERRKFYEAQRMAYADEMDILTILHEKSPTPIMLTNNINMRGDFGLPVVVYDAGYYIAGKDKDPKGTAFDRAWAGRIHHAITYAQMYGLDEEVATLTELLNSNSKLIQATILVSQVEGLNVVASKNRLRAYFGSSLSDRELNNVYADASRYARAYLSAMTRDEIRNPYYHLAKRYVELHGEVSSLNPSNKVLKYLGVDITNVEEVLKAKQAIERANKQYSTSQDIILTDNDVFTLAQQDGLTNKFGVDGQTIEAAINEMVDNNVISEETAELYRGMFSIILTHNEEFSNNLSIILDPDLNRAGLSSRYGDRFVIKLNPDLIKKRSGLEALEIMAHELSHIARLRHLETNSQEYLGFLEVFKSTSGKDAISDMVSYMFAGDQGEINYLIQHYTRNPEEFLAEWGAFVLISQTIKNKTVVNRISKLREKYEVVDKATSWWERAFNRMRKLVSSITQRMKAFKDINPQAMKYMDDVVEVMFNFGNTYSRSRAAVYNMSKTLGYPPVEISQGLGFAEESEIMSMNVKIQKYNDLKNKTLTETERAEFGQLELELKPYLEGELSKTILGQDTQEYIESLSKLMKFNSGVLEITENATTSSQRIALATFVLERVIKNRGKRSESLSMISKILKDMPKASAVRSRLVDILVSGVARKVGQESNRVFPFELTMSGRGGGTSANLTYAAAEPILVALGFLLDTTKGGGIFPQSSGGLIKDLNYIQQWSRPVVLMAANIKSGHGSESENLIKSAAFYYLLYGRPSDKSGLGEIGARLTDTMFKKAKLYAETYSKAMSNYSDLAVKYKTYSQNFIPPDDFIGLRINNTFFERSTAETTRIFANALAKKLRKKVLDNMTEDGIADPYSLYLSGGIFPLYGTNDGEFNAINTFYNRLADVDENDPRKLILFDIEEYAYKMWKEENPLSNTTSSSFRNELRSQTNLGRQRYGSYILRAALYNLRKAKAGATYKDIMPNLTSAQLQTVLEHLRARINTDFNNFSDVSTQTNDIAQGRLGDIFYGTAAPPKYFKQNDGRKISGPIQLRVAKMINTHGHNTILPNTKALDLNAQDIYVNEDDLSPEERKILRSGFSVDLKSIIVGMERTMASSSYSRKAIQDLTGISNVSFSQLIKSIKEAQGMDSEWIAVLDEVERKYNLSIGRATRIDENQGSGSESFALKIADVFTTALWGPNRNIAALVNEGSLSVINSTLYKGNPFGFISDFLPIAASLLVRIFNKGAGNRLLNKSKMMAVPQALFELDTATRGFTEHQLVDKDNEEMSHDLDTNGFKASNKISALTGWFWQKLKDSHLIAEPALRAAMLLQGQNILFRRVSKLKQYAEYINNYKGEKNQQMYKEAAESVGGIGIVDFGGSEGLLVQFMDEAGLLNETTIKAINYIIKEYGLSKTGVFQREYLDVSKLQRQIEESTSARLFDVLPNSDKLTKNDLYTAITAIHKFSLEVMRSAITEGNTLDRPTEPRPLSHLIHLYRSFPKLFVTQHAIDAYGRSTPTIFATKIISASALDLLYNFVLLYVAGLITDDDLERIKKGQIEGSDFGKLATMMARNPFFTTRMLPSIFASLIGSLTTAAVSKEKMSYYDVMRLALPPSLAATVSGVWKGISGITDIAEGKNFSEDGWNMTNTQMDFLLRLIPLIDPITRYAITNSMFEDPDTSRPPSSSSPYTVSNSIMDNIMISPEETLKNLLREIAPSGNIPVTPKMLITPPEDVPRPNMDQASQKVQKPAQEISELPAANLESQTQTPKDSNRATSPETPPPNLTGES